MNVLAWLQVCKPVLDRLGKLPQEPGEARTRLLQCLTLLSSLLNLLSLPTHLSAFLRPGQLSSVDFLSRQASTEVLPTFCPLFKYRRGPTFVLLCRHVL